MILHRCFAWNERDLYGCLYLSVTALSHVVEQLARFRGQRLSSPLLRRRGLPLGLAELDPR